MAFGMIFRGLAITKLNEQDINEYLLLRYRLLMPPYVISSKAGYMRSKGLIYQVFEYNPDFVGMLAEGNIVSIP